MGSGGEMNGGGASAGKWSAGGAATGSDSREQVAAISRACSWDSSGRISRTNACICSSSRIRRKEGCSSCRAADGAGVLATVAYEGTARVVAWTVCEQERVEGRAEETEGRAGEIEGRARGTGGRAGETRGRAGETGGRAGETGGRAGGTGGREREASPATGMVDDARPPFPIPAAVEPESRPRRPRGLPGRARPPGGPGNRCSLHKRAP